jgi:hypothetical protein
VPPWAGGEGELAFVGDDEAHAAAELDALLALGWVVDLDLGKRRKRCPP